MGKPRRSQAGTQCLTPITCVCTGKAMLRPPIINPRFPLSPFLSLSLPIPIFLPLSTFISNLSPMPGTLSPTFPQVPDTQARPTQLYPPYAQVLASCPQG